MITIKMSAMNDALLENQKCWTKDGLLCGPEHEMADLSARNVETLRAYVVAAEANGATFPEFAEAIAAKHEGDSTALDNILSS